MNDYSCVFCGNENGNAIIRDAPTEEQKRVKCGAPRCGLTFSAADSRAAKEAGQLPDGLPEEPPVPEQDAGRATEIAGPGVQTAPEGGLAKKAPRTPSFVILSKDRTDSEFCTKKNLRSRVIVWTAQERKFDVFELTQKKVAAKLSIE